VTDEFWTDDPLHSSEGDTLARKPYACAAAKLIADSHSFETSVVYGLSGSWGSGMSSLINMIVGELRAKHSDWSVARFTPWATSDVSGLLSEFYASLAEPLPADKSEMLKNSLGVIARVAAPAAAMVPFAGAVVGNEVHVRMATGRRRRRTGPRDGITEVRPATTTPVHHPRHAARKRGRPRARLVVNRRWHCA
jgi:hypothetical protein